jgi:CheY-like chemotaxis protein
MAAPLRILVVDDDPDIVDYLSSFFGDHGSGNGRGNGRGSCVSLSIVRIVGDRGALTGAGASASRPLHPTILPRRSFESPQ